MWPYFSCFVDPTKVGELNDSLLALIPKQDSVTNMKQFQPISLCNVSYKTITKLVARRLRGFMPKLVGPCQCCFMPRRHANDNIAIAQEIFHSMRRKKGVKGWMAIKINLENAYDRLKWAFVKETLEDADLPSNLVSLISHCVSTVRMHAFWNVEALEGFMPQRGICQGTPFPRTYLFFVLNDFFQELSLAVEKKVLRPVKVARNGPSISHLAFADDLILFTESTSEQAQVMSSILELLCVSSGQRVSRDKMRIYFSRNVDRITKQKISEL